MARRKEIWKEALPPPLFFIASSVSSSTNEISYQGQRIFVFVSKEISFPLDPRKWRRAQHNEAVTRHKTRNLYGNSSYSATLNAIRLELLFQSRRMWNSTKISKKNILFVDFLNSRHWRWLVSSSSSPSIGPTWKNIREREIKNMKL